MQVTMMWSLVLILLIASVRIYCAEPPWWRSAVYYRMLVDSFKDGDGDGLGDLLGATKQISYIRALGADATILSPLSSRSSDCTKPGILDPVTIDQRYGNLESYARFIDKAKKIELKVVVTIPLQTISAASEWFNSSANRVIGHEDWVLWQDGKPDESPSTDENVDTWVWHEGRNSFWASKNKEAVLNLCSDGLASALASAQCGWLRRGATGVLLDPDFSKDIKCGERLLKKMAAEAMSCVRAVILSNRVILVESKLRPELAARYYADGGVGANSVINSALTMDSMRTSAELALDFYAAMLNSPHDMAPTWITSSSTANSSRTCSRLGSEMVDAINLLALILPGAAMIQQGDELGAADTVMEWAVNNEKCWPSDPRPAAAPFPWDDSVNAGFSAGEPWLPLAPNYRYANAKMEFSNDLSHVGVVKIGDAMRRSPAIGPHVEIHRLGQTLAVLRWGGSGSLLVITNLSKDQTDVQLFKVPGLPPQMTVAACSVGSGKSSGNHIDIENPIRLAPGETLLLAGAPRHCGGPGPVDKIANKLQEGWQKINKYFNNK